MTFLGSGSQDGMLCVWDLTTGACVYSIQAHDGAVLSLAHSPSYVVSMGSDEKLCVWERFHGHLINTINLVSYIFTISIKHFIKIFQSYYISTKIISLFIN